MAWEHDRYMELSDGREVLVCFIVENYGSEPSGLSGPPENYDPGSGPELYIDKCLLEDGTEVKISDEERERLEQVIIDNPDWCMPDPYDDYYD